MQSKLLCVPGDQAKKSGYHESHAAMSHPTPRGRKPSGGNRHYPKPEPGLPDHRYHESKQPCGIPPHRGASPREVADITPCRNQAPELLPSQIHATLLHLTPQGHEPSGGDRHYAKAGPGLHDYCFHGSRQPCRILSRSARALGNRKTLPRDGTRAPGLLPARIRATMLHLAPQGREPSGGDRDYPRPDPRLPDYCYHESQATMPHPAPRGASPREAAEITQA